MNKKIFKCLMLSVLVAFMAGCASSGVNQDKSKPTVSEAKATNSVLKRMRIAMTLHSKGDWKDSNDHVEAVLRILCARPKISLGREVGSWLIAEDMRRYSGDPYELVFLHTLAMLNYAMLGEIDEALVEARRSDLLQRWMKDEGKDSIGDPLARYISAKLYEANEELDDAYIDMVKAEKAFAKYEKKDVVGVPTFLGLNLIRLAERTGNTKALKKWKKKYKEEEAPEKKTGEVLVLAYTSGFSVIEDNGDSCTVSGSGNNPQNLESVYDVEALADYAMERRKRKGRFRNAMRIGVRAVIGTCLVIAAVAADVALEDHVFSGDAIEGAAVLVEGGDQRDRRRWENMPGEILATRLVLPAGKQDISIVVKNAGEIKSVVRKSVMVESGKLVLIMSQLSEAQNIMRVSPALPDRRLQ